MIRQVLIGLGVLSVLGCGAQQTEPVDPAAPTEDDSAQNLQIESGGDVELVGSSAEQEAAKPQPAPAALAVRYHVAPEGLRVVVSGVVFEPRATPVRIGAGWGVKIDVHAQAEDDGPHVLFSPDQGPMAFYAVVERGGSVEKLGDERQGRGEQSVTADGVDFSRTWPGDMPMKPLRAGQKLELQVGLWGVGTSAVAHRPLRGFFTLKMVAGTAQPQPIISPPGTAE